MNAPAPSAVSPAAPCVPQLHVERHVERLSDRLALADAEPPSLLAACIRMLKLTGGSPYWTGETHAALEFMERAVAAALTTPAPTEHDLANALLLAQSGIGM